MAKPPEIPDTGPDYTEVIETIQEATNGIDFGPDFMTDLLLFFLDNSKELFSGQTTFFILGSYKKYPIRRLRFAARELNSRPMTYAFILCDLLNPEELKQEWLGEYSAANSNDDETSDRNPDYPLSHCQFYLLTVYSDYIVPIFEGRHAGPSVELAELRNNFFEKSHVFQRLYDELDDDSLSSGNKISPDVDLSGPYSRPQEDLFSLFDHEDRLVKWTRRSDLAAKIQTLPKN